MIGAIELAPSSRVFATREESIGVAPSRLLELLACEDDELAVSFLSSEDDELEVFSLLFSLSLDVALPSSDDSTNSTSDPFEESVAVRC